MEKRLARSRNSDSTEFARNQRICSNEFVRDVWQMVRGRRCCGEKFRREYSIGPYTVDFVCVALKLVVEVDGEHHFTDEGIRHDKKRDGYLKELGYTVLRIRGYGVLNEPGKVRDRIVDSIKNLRRVSPLTPNPSPQIVRGKAYASSISFRANNLGERGAIF